MDGRAPACAPASDQPGRRRPGSAARAAGSASAGDRARGAGRSFSRSTTARAPCSTAVATAATRSAARPHWRAVGEHEQRAAGSQRRAGRRSGWTPRRASGAGSARPGRRAGPASTACAHRQGHQLRVAGPGHRRGEQHRVAAQLHGQRRVGRGTDARRPGRPGPSTDSRISAMLCGLRMPRPLPIGEPSGITAAQPTSASRRAMIGSSLVYGSTVKPSATSCLGRVEQLDRVGQQGVLVADHLELDPGRCRTPPGPAWRSSTASRAVMQPAVLGSSRTLHRSSTSSSDPLRRGLDPAQRDRDQLRCRRPTMARSSTSRLGTPPVPSSSRESKRLAGNRQRVSRPSRSASRHRRQHLDPVPVGERVSCPTRRAGTTSPLRATATRRRSSARRPRPASPTVPAVGHLGGRAVDASRSSSRPPRSRVRPSGGEPVRREPGATAGSSPVASRSAIASAGDRGQQDAVAVVAGGERPGRAARDGPEQRRVVGRAGRDRAASRPAPAR